MLDSKLAAALPLLSLYLLNGAQNFVSITPEGNIAINKSMVLPRLVQQSHGSLIAPDPF